MGINARFGTRISEIRAAECSSAEAVGDWVCISDDPPNGTDYVRKADPADFTKMPAVGVVVSKSAPTQCRVQWFGETPDIFSGLSSGEYYFVGTDSRSADLPPEPTTAPLFTQFVGVATAPTRMYVRPNDRLVRRIP